MKLDCILAATNELPLYIEFIPFFINTWKKLYPKIDTKIILIAEKIPEEYEQYIEHIILFKPIKNIPTAFVSQYIRILYPAILNYQNGVMITDIDMVPMNRHFFTKTIESFDNNKFIVLRNYFKTINQIAICYNVAIPKVWRDIFGITNIDDINNRLLNNYKEYKGWMHDQLDLYLYVNKWSKKETDVVILEDEDTGFARLNRRCFKLNSDVIQQIKDGYYVDYHCNRPYSEHKINNKIFDIL